MNQKDLLFEIGCEELPPAYQVSLADNLAKLITKSLQEKKITEIIEIVKSIFEKLRIVFILTKKYCFNL